MTKVKQKGATRNKISLWNLFRLIALTLTPVLATDANAESVLMFQAGNDTLEMTADDVAFAQAKVDRISYTSVEIGLVPAKAQIFLEFTSQHVSEQMKIIVCNRIIAEPIIVQPMSGKHFQLTGSFTDQEAKDISRQLKSPSCGPVSLLEKAEPDATKSSHLG